jgi:group I intron endonuclease
MTFRQSNNIDRRLKTYEKEKCKGQIRLYASLKKYGWHSHYFSVIEFCPEDELNMKERLWQEFYDVLSTYGLNCKLTDTEHLAGKMHDEVKEKIRQAHTGKPKSEEHKKELHDCKLGNAYHKSFKHLVKHSRKSKGKRRKPQTAETIRLRVKATGKTYQEKYPDGYKHSARSKAKIFKLSKNRFGFRSWIKNLC